VGSVISGAPDAIEGVKERGRVQNKDLSSPTLVRTLFEGRKEAEELRCRE
jgi:hypothetical protein